MELCEIAVFILNVKYKYNMNAKKTKYQWRGFKMFIITVKKNTWYMALYRLRGENSGGGNESFIWGSTGWTSKKSQKVSVFSLSLFVILQTCFQSYLILTKLFINKIAKKFFYFIIWRMAVRVLNPRNIYVAFANVITWFFLHCWVLKFQFLYTKRFVRNTNFPLKSA